MTYRPSKMDRMVFHLDLPYIKSEYELLTFNNIHPAQATTNQNIIRN